MSDIYINIFVIIRIFPHQHVLNFGRNFLLFELLPKGNSFSWKLLVGETLLNELHSGLNYFVVNSRKGLCKIFQLSKSGSRIYRSVS